MSEREAPNVKNLQSAIASQLGTDNIDSVELFEVPKTSSRAVRIQTLEEVLGDFDADKDDGTLSYIVQIRPNRVVAKGPVAAPEAPSVEAKDESNPDLTEVYYPDGRLKVSALLEHASVLLQSNEFALARNIYETIRKSGDHSALAHFGIGLTYEKQHDVEKAQLHFEESIAFHPTVKAYQHLAIVLLQQEKDQYASEVFERALALPNLTAPQKFELHKAAGNCRMRLNQFDEASGHYLQAIESNPQAFEVITNLGLTLMKAGDAERAIEYFDRATEIKADCAAAHYGKACCLQALNRSAEAFDAFQATLQINIQQSMAIFNLIKIAYELRRYSEAEPLVAKYAESAPVNSNLLYSLAGIYYHIGRPARARSIIGKILNIDPEHSGASELLGIIEKNSQEG